MIRFLMLWAAVTAMSYGFIYVAARKEKQIIRKLIGRLFISSAVAMVFIIILFSVNHLSGV